MGVVITSSVGLRSKDQKGAISAEVPLLTDMQSFKSNFSLFLPYNGKVSSGLLSAELARSSHKTAIFTPSAQPIGWRMPIYL